MPRALLLALLALAACSDPSDAEAAYAIAQRAVLVELAQPASAVFPPLPDDAMELVMGGIDEVDIRKPWSGHPWWKVSGFVDWQNQPGVPIRSHYAVNLTRLETPLGVDRFRVESVEFLAY